MVIIVSPQGQLANRMLHASHFIANKIENNYSLYHICFEDYYHLFDEQLGLKETKKYIHFINIRQRAFQKLINLILAIFRKTYKYTNGNFLFFTYIFIPIVIDSDSGIDMMSSEFIAKTKRLTLIDGWDFRNELLLTKYRESILNVFQPNKKYLIESESIIKKLRNQYEIIIGVHIRRGDYRQFMNGKYFYDDMYYKTKMEEVLNFHSFQGKKVLFLVCSNEKIESETFNNLNTNIIQRHLVVDLLLLSKCNLIIGPPSTFSMWASYYGSTPRCFLYKEQEKLSLDSFSIYGVNE